MTDKTMAKLREDEEREADNSALIDGTYNSESKSSILGCIEKAQKLEHAERQMRLEESKQKLEAEKFEFQKKQSKKDNFVKIFVASVTGAGAIIAGAAKIAQVVFQRKYVKEAYKIEQVTSIASPTARSLIKDGTSPRL